MSTWRDRNTTEDVDVARARRWLCCYGKLSEERAQVMMSDFRIATQGKVLWKIPSGT
jgi:hypothetical protein